MVLVACRFSRGGCGDRSLLAGTWGLVVICVLILLKASTSQRSSPRSLGDVPSAVRTHHERELGPETKSQRDTDKDTWAPGSPVGVPAHRASGGSGENILWESETRGSSPGLQKNKEHKGHWLCSNSEPNTGDMRGLSSPSQGWVSPASWRVERLKSQGTIACPRSTLLPSCSVCSVTSQTILSWKFFPAPPHSGLLLVTPLSFFLPFPFR